MRVLQPFLFCTWIAVSSCGMVKGEDEDLPGEVGEGRFDSLLTQSPFLRLIRPEQTYVLRGVASFDGCAHVTLHHRETQESVIVKEGEANPLGMELMRVSGATPEDLQVTIRFQGEELEFAYEATQLSPVMKPGMRDTIRYDDQGRVRTTEELMKKFLSMTKAQQQKYLKWKEEVQLKARPELRYSKERIPYAHEALDAIKRGQEPPDPRRR